MAKTITHLHGCGRCRDTFVCSCDQPRTTDPDCIRCIGGHQRTTIHRGRLPRKCCLTDIRPARKDEAVNYRLAGTRAWFMCATCKRAFIYQPKELVA